MHLNHTINHGVNHLIFVNVTALSSKRFILLTVGTWCSAALVT